MRNVFALLLVACGLLGLIAGLSCAPTAPYTEPDYTFPDPIDAVARNIILEVKTLYGSLFLDSLLMPTEGEILIHVEDTTAWQLGSSLEIYATTTGYYTELFFCENDRTIIVDLDKVPPATDAMTGVIIGTQGWYNDNYLREQTLVISHRESEFSDTVTTNKAGRWGIQNAPLGAYNISFTEYTYYGVDSVTFSMTNGHGVDYLDHIFEEASQVDAPNIYLYPETQTDISVDLSFPSGGGIILSEPPYNSGWNVNVSPEGLIDGHFDYLFYEAKVRMPLQQTYGWLLDGSKLEQELRQLLLTQNFVGREIDDFIDFWLPRISGSPWYAICPQAAEMMSTLTISPKPDTILRALYTIRPISRKVNLITPPEDINFERAGFTVVEWGVIDWHK